jgi:hypothetical protein
MPTDRYIASHMAMAGDYVPEPPDGWPEERRERFRRIAAALPCGWWDSSNEPLLREYVLAVEASERLQDTLDGMQDEAEWLDLFASLDELNALLTARDRESKRALSLARAMRLPQLSLPPRREGSDSPADPARAPWAT